MVGYLSMLMGTSYPVDFALSEVAVGSGRLRPG